MKNVLVINSSLNKKKATQTKKLSQSIERYKETLVFLWHERNLAAHRSSSLTMEEMTAWGTAANWRRC